MTAKIREILTHIPPLPGIYIMKGAQGGPLYIGKAKSLKNRVSSYFQDSSSHSGRTMSMIRQVRDIDFIVTKNEIEALILESNFIKKHQPKYNVLLKDDKHYPYFRLSTRDPFPRLEIVRKVKKNGGAYFGPYAKAGEARKTLRLIYKIFPVRQCKESLDGSRKHRPCLNFQMHQCPAPCFGKISRDEYGKIIREVMLFLKGRNLTLVDCLRKDMEDASKGLEFEKAARIRDQIAAVQTITGKQVSDFSREEDLDVLGFYMEHRLARMQILSVRGGKIMTQRSYSLHHEEGTEGREVLGSFIKQYYKTALFLPPEIVIGEEVRDRTLIGRWLSSRKGKKVRIIRPVKGKKRLLVRMAEENARTSFFKTVHDQERKKNVLLEVRDLLSLKKPPRLIDAFDISTTFGTSAVGGVVSFVEGESEKGRYRRFSMKREDLMDDYAMIEETLTRHYRNFQGEVPDLILIDGGRGHLNRAVRVMNDLNLPSIELVAVAKGRSRRSPESDAIFRPGSPEPVPSSLHHPGRQFLLAVRDEAHRFAITTHRGLRRKKSRHSVLDEIQGVGPKRKLALIRQFKGVDAIKKARLEELRTVPGITNPLAKKIREVLGNLI